MKEDSEVDEGFWKRSKIQPAGIVSGDRGTAVETGNGYGSKRIDGWGADENRKEKFI